MLGGASKKNAHKFILRLLQAVTPFGRFGIGRADRVVRDRKPRPRQLQPGVDGLDSRNRMTGGVSFSNRLLSIVAPLNSGNSAAAALDTAHNAVQVTPNGSTQEFAASQVTAIFFESGFGGGDTFVNSTNS